MTPNYRALLIAMAILPGSGGGRMAAQRPTEQPRSLSTITTYTFVIGSGFLCEPGDTSMCPATARGHSQDSYEMTGAGTFDAQSKSVKAAGTYSHKAPNGNLLENGVWIATELVAFESYGVAPGAVLSRGLAFAPASFGSKRFPTLSRPMPTGGLAVFRIRLLPTQGSPTSAVLQANCALGDVPRGRSVEGIRLTLEKNGGEFSEEVSGRVMFLTTRAEVSAPAKAAEQEATPEVSGKPQK